MDSEEMDLRHISATGDSAGPSVTNRASASSENSRTGRNNFLEPSSPERPHSCLHCSSVFSSAKDLKRHQLKHNTVGFYKCCCSTEIHRKDNYIRHLQKCAAVVAAEHRSYPTAAEMRCGRCGRVSNDFALHRSHIKKCGDGKKGRPPKGEV